MMDTKKYMPKRQDIKSILIIGAGPIMIGQGINLIIQEHKLVEH